jgi:hypothetical protein
MPHTNIVFFCILVLWRANVQCWPFLCLWLPLTIFRDVESQNPENLPWQIGALPTKPQIPFCVDFRRTRVRRPLLFLCRLFLMFEGWLDSNPKSLPKSICALPFWPPTSLTLFTHPSTLYKFPLERSKGLKHVSEFIEKSMTSKIHCNPFHLN